MTTHYNLEGRGSRKPADCLLVSSCSTENSLIHMKTQYERNMQ